MSSITVLDIVIIVLYIVAIGMVGFLSSRKVKNSSDYYVAGRTLSPFVLLATVCASIIGGSALIGRGGYAYTGGMVSVAIAAPYMIGMFLFSLFSKKISVFGKNYNINSLPEFLGYRFGKPVQFFAAAMVAYTSIATVAAQISATGTIVSAIGGDNVSYFVGALLATIVFTVYTTSSGLFGVVYTDVIQFIVLTVFVYLLLPFRAVGEVGGFVELFNKVDPQMWKLNLTPEIITLIVTNFVTVIAGAELWQRAFAAKDGKSAFKGQFGGTVVYAVTIVITMFVGVCAAVLFPTLIQDYGTADYAIPVMIIKILPAGLTGLALAGVISVMMSSADTYLLCASQSIVLDICQVVKPDLSEKRSMMISRISSVVFGACSFLIAMFFTSAYDALMFGWTFYAATLGVPCLVSLIWKKATTPGMLAGMGTGFAVSIVWNILGSPFGIGSTIIGVVLNAIVLFTVSLLTYKKYPSKVCTQD